MLSVIGDCPDKNLQQLFRQTACVLAIFSILFLAGTSIAREPDEVKFPSGKLLLQGFIYKPEGKGPFPAVLYNHGSERKPGWKPEIGEFFASNGYVLFVPHRRSHGRSPGDSFVDSLYEQGARSTVAVNEILFEDQVAALSYLKGLPYVDSSRIAVAGCSYGGIQTILAAERNLGFRAAIPFAAAAITWSKSHSLQIRLIDAVRKAAVPMLLIQAENDYDLTPSRTLAKELESLGKPYKLVIFPPYGNTPQEGHGAFCFRGADVWGQEVLSFLSTHMQR